VWKKKKQRQQKQSGKDKAVGCRASVNSRVVARHKRGAPHMPHHFTCDAHSHDKNISATSETRNTTDTYDIPSRLAIAVTVSVLAIIDNHSFSESTSGSTVPSLASSLWHVRTRRSAAARQTRLRTKSQTTMTVCKPPRNPCSGVVAGGTPQQRPKGARLRKSKRSRRRKYLPTYPPMMRAFHSRTILYRPLLVTAEPALIVSFRIS
jgi:hypothetical protein